MTGDGVFAALDRVFTAKNGKSSEEFPNRKLVLGHLRAADGTVLDEVLATVSRAPHSYTGEDTAELQCHGSPAVLAAGLEALFRAGARQAQPGEFTKRAFLNGCLDLSQAEAVIDLIEAQSVEAAANAVGQLSGALGKKIDPIYDKITDILAHFHAVLDYPDEDIEDFRMAEFRGILAGCRRELQDLEASYGRGQVLKNGIAAVILGSPNAGKSSLLNALAGFERVIVTDVPGTTRDTVEQTLRLGKHLVRLTDTAGIRDTDDKIEEMGVRRSLEAARQAHLALFVCDGSRPLAAEDLQAMEEAKKAPVSIGVINKADLPAVVENLPMEHVVTVSALTGEGVTELEALANRLLGDNVSADGCVLTNARQVSCVAKAGQALDAVLASMDLGFTPDAVLVDAEEALQQLGLVTGRSMQEEVVGRIFERFCVGK
jgi:tRNA modification GTPase